MSRDLPETPEYLAVAEHLRRVHEPSFGRPHEAHDPHTTVDGSRIVVTASIFDELSSLPRTALFTVIGDTLHPVTGATGSARNGRFSPDGTTLAFLSDRGREGIFQLFLLDDRELSEAVAAPEVTGTVEYLHWSPDGRQVLLGVAGLGADLSGGQGSGTNIFVDPDVPDWLPLVDDGVPASAWRSLWLFTVGSAELRQLIGDGTNCWEANWCGPDQIVAVTSDAPNEDDWYHSVLTLIDANNGQGRLLARSDVQLGMPAGAPDGTRICVVEAVCSDRWVVAGNLMILDVTSGSRTYVDTHDTDVTSVQWIDAHRLGYLGQRHLDSVAGVVDTTTGSAAEVFSTPTSCGDRYPEGWFTGEGRVVVVQDAYQLPPQAAVIGPNGVEVVATLAHPGTDYLRSVAGQSEPVRWAAPDGLEIEGILCLPPGQGPFPLVVNIHGGPVWAFRDRWSMGYAWVPLLVSRGYAVLNPNPRGSGGRGQTFARRVVGDMGGADTYDYLSGIDALVERGVADPERIGLIGGSYGGYMSSWLVTQDQRFAAAVPIAPVTDWYSNSFTSNLARWGAAFLDADPEEPISRMHTRSPVLHASKVRTPCLSVAGGNDLCTPPGQAREFHNALRQHGLESVLVIYPQEGHGVRSYPAMVDFLSRVLGWFERYMPA
jgi:dipeptidyl aminopeptidase/acylaminoacyl peptidase